MAHLKHISELTPRARALRRNMTAEERHLWYDFLRGYPVRFLRQKIIDGYIADFYCAKAQLVIELDGRQHFTDDGLIYDEARDRHLNAWDLEVLRFPNVEIWERFSEVCQKIDHTVKLRTNASQ